jgi:ATP-dependent exoDNAse (exonuclease V) beta subunit
MNEEKDVYHPLVSVALSSSAGSGKTFALTTRLISMLLDGIKPSEIVAITFTKFAANDIRKKLLERVLAIEGGDERETVLFCDLLNMKKDVIVKKAQAVKSDLILNFSLLQISTIHSFFLKIIKSFPRETGLLSDLLVIDEIAQRSYLKESLARFYELFQNDGALLDRVYHFITNYRETAVTSERVLMDIYSSIDGKSYQLGRFIHGDDPLESAGRNFSLRKKVFLSPEIVQKMDFLIGVMNDYSRENGKNRYVDSFVRGLEDFRQYRNIKKLSALTPFQSDAEKGLVNYLAKLCRTLPVEKAIHFKESLSDIHKALVSYFASQNDYYLHTWIDIYKRVNHFYRDIKEVAQAVDFNDIEYQAKEFLTGITDFGYFDYRMGSNIKYILIDEFQDTSELQWDTLRPLVEKSLRKQGSLFYVGDVKQSIYRWRGGDPYLFDRVCSQLHIDKKFLRYTYRQNEILLNFVNTVFKKITDRIFPPFEYVQQHLPAERRGEEEGYVSVIQLSNKEKMRDELLDRILRLQKTGVAPDDIAVLCRTNSGVEEIENLFHRFGIPFTSVGRSALFKDYSIMDVVNILNLVLNPDEGLYAAGLLRSPLFSASYSLLERCRDEGGRIGLSGLKKAAPDIYRIIISLTGRSRYLTPSQFLQRVYGEFGFFSIYPHKREVLLRFLELAYTFESVNKTITLHDFSRYLEENSELLTLRLSVEHGVKLMTVHAAKGLEFHTVILPYLNQPFKFRLDGKPLCQRESGGGDVRCVIARSDYRQYLSGETSVRELFEEAETQYRMDELNILYVALTRARKNLILLPLAKGRSETVGDVLLEALENSYDYPYQYRDGAENLFKMEMGTPVESVEEDEVRGEREKVYEDFKTTGGTKGGVLLSEEKAPDFGSEDQPVDFRSKRTGTLKGLVFHRAIEMIKSLPVDETFVEDALQRAVAFEGLGYTKKEREDSLSQARKSVKNVLTDTRLSKYFSPRALTETVSFSSRYRNFIGRIDRICMNENIEVLDFKTNRIHDTEQIDKLVHHYRDQVVTYRDALKKVYPKKPVRGYLYFTDAEYAGRLVSVC